MKCNFISMEHPTLNNDIPIKDQLTSLLLVHSECCIYAVPENLRQVNEDAYRPLLVSIGPVHCRDTRLADMHRQKLRYLQSFLLRYPECCLDKCLDFAKEWKDRARKCYIETIPLPSSTTNEDVFTEMLLLDAAFIIELFMRNYSYEQNDPSIRVGLDDRVFNKPRAIIDVTRDLRLEENQIPFFILVDLYKQAIESSLRHPHPSILEIICKFFKVERVPQGMNLDGIEHLLGFLRECYMPTKRRDQSLMNNQKFEFTSSATKLKEAGVKFVVMENANLLDIGFTKGVLLIPRLQVTDDTESLFRNIMAFEQCHHYYDSYIIDYFAFLNSLINTAEDVEILVKRQIIENWLGNNDEVANLFSKLFKEIRLQDAKFYYSGVCRDLNAYAKTRSHRWKAILKSKYFNHPWALVAFGYAIFVMILAVLQVLSGFKSVNWI
ncbi:hypothetical protein vseg_014148 [Gypsophila vaccaria]